VKLFRHRLRVAGTGVTPFLNRLLSLDFSSGISGYGLLLDPAGRLVGGAYWQPEPEGWLALGTESMITALAEALPRYIFFRDAVAIQVLSPALVSAQADPYGTYHDLGQPARILTVEAATDGPVDPFGWQRRSAGFPVLGLEFLTGDLPLEWDYGFALARKGCYPGQEVVERMTTKQRRAKGRILARQHTVGLTWPSSQVADLRAPILHEGRYLALGLTPDRQEPVAR